MARDVVKELSEVEAAAVLGECARTAAVVLNTGAVGRHDLAGRVFNRLISERKLLAAFYTSIPASSLLAGLALPKDRWRQVDWNDIEALSRLRVVDPACGTGTLLMAAYRQIVENSSAVTADIFNTSLLHKALVGGCDSRGRRRAGCHSPDRSNACGNVPTVRFEQMQLHTLRLGRDLSEKIWLGSLELAARSRNSILLLYNHRTDRGGERFRRHQCASLGRSGYL